MYGYIYIKDGALHFEPETGNDWDRLEDLMVSRPSGISSVVERKTYL